MAPDVSSDQAGRAPAVVRPPVGYKQRLVIQVLWHPEFKGQDGGPGGREYAEHLYSVMTRDLHDPLARGDGIPVLYRSTPEGGQSVPAAFALDEAEHTVVIALVDDKMVGDDAWSDYVGGYADAIKASDGRHRLIPTAFSTNAFNLDMARVTPVNFIRLYEAPPEERVARFTIGVTHELCRTLERRPSATDPKAKAEPPDRVMIFISHAKAGDESAVVDGLRTLLGKAAASGADEKLVRRIMEFFKDNMDEEPTGVKFDRFALEAGQDRLDDLLSGLRQLFQSYSMLDRGKVISESVRDFIRGQLNLETFFDAQEIGYGEEFAGVIERSIKRSAFLTVQTDAYSGRVWCQLEVLLAKRYRRPVLVVNAVRSGERRAFPYLGNVPTIRFRGMGRPNYLEIISQMLLEVLRTLHFEQQFEDLRRLFQIDQDIRCLTLSPELLTLLDLRRDYKAVKRFVYPDPPLSDGELALLNAFDPELTVTTPVFLLGTNAKSADRDAPETTATTGPTPPFGGKTVALSIGDSPELNALGLSPPHVQDAATGFARYLLASGADLAYGGDLRPGGFTDVLLDLVRMHNAEAKLGPTPRLKGFLAWPRDVALTNAEKARYKGVCEFIKVGPPADVASLVAARPAAGSAEDRYLNARCLTAMREAMDEKEDGRYHVDARVLMGGKILGYSGRYPGLVEEAYLALRDGLPLYMIGGFGGCARVVIEALVGAKLRRRVVGVYPDLQVEIVLEPFPDGIPRELDPTLQLAQAGYADLVAQYEQRKAEVGANGTIDYGEIAGFFRARGVSWDESGPTLEKRLEAGLECLNNGLDVKQNLQLFTTPHLYDMFRLVLLGLLKARYRS